MSRVVSMLCSGRWSVLKAGTILAHPAVTTSPGPQALTRWFGQSPCLAGSPADLDKAKERLGTLTEDPGNDVKLKLYAIFKQVKKNSAINDHLILQEGHNQCPSPVT